MYGYCENCGRNAFFCHCTWEEMRQAREIIRRREATERRAKGKPTLVEQEAAKQ